MIHIIAYTLLSITLIRLAYSNMKINKSFNEILYYNEEMVSRFNEVFEELLRRDEELQLTKNNMNLYKEDRDSLIQTIKGLIPGHPD